MALCRTLGDGALRRSEAAALEWHDLAIEPDGTGRLTVRHRRRTRLAVARSWPAPPRPCGRSRRSGGGRRMRAGSSPSTPAASAAAYAAGLGVGFSGHSGRVGLARRTTARGAPTANVRRQGQWR